jgi:hypothetical protein
MKVSSQARQHDCSVEFSTPKGLLGTSHGNAASAGTHFHGPIAGITTMDILLEIETLISPLSPFSFFNIFEHFPSSTFLFLFYLAMTYPSIQ